MIIIPLLIILSFYLLMLGIIYLLAKRYIQKNINPHMLILINCVIAYFIAMLFVYGQDAYLSYQLAQFDINADGIFSGKEKTLEQQKAFDRVINDTGRNMAPFILTAFTFAYGVIMSILCLYYGLLKEAYNKN